MEPAAYPARNTEELCAVHTFVNLLDLNRVKPSVNALDKIPNHDGFVELVDERQRPVGELKVQIKKIPDNSLQFDCPTALVAYSTTGSFPFVLICVDVGNQKAYWRHISTLMAGVKPEQKTFVVRFQPVVDEIGAKFPYFERWRSLCSDYAKRVSEFPRLKQIVEERIGLTGLADEERRTFQLFIDEVNILLDVDLPIVKHECFADTWKLGVTIHRSDAEVVAYSMYTVQNGENSPIIIHVPQAEEPPKIVIDKDREIHGLINFSLEGGLGKEISKQWATREGFGNPVKAAREFVFWRLTRLFREKRLHIHGRNQSVELIISFLREHAHTVGLTIADTYKMEDISYGLNVFLPMWYSLAFPRVMAHFQKYYGEMLRGNPLPSFEQIANSKPQPEHPTEAEVREAIASGKQPLSYLIRTDRFAIRSLSQAVQFLVAADVQEISRLYRPTTVRGTWLSGCYTSEDLKCNVLTMLQGAAEDYDDFVKGNRFGRLDSPLVAREIALVFAGNSRKWTDSRFSAVMDEYHVENADRSLPLMTFLDLAEEPNGCALNHRVLTLRGVQRKCDISGKSGLGRIFEERPIQATLYDWLLSDLERRFGKKLSI